MAPNRGAQTIAAVARVQTLYLSKNMLASLEGVEQFRELKALSAADNALGDLATLGALREAGIQLEAANFEGNPIADLPNYCAHVRALAAVKLHGQC